MKRKYYHPKRIFVVISSTILPSLAFAVRRGSRRRRGSLAARFRLAASSKLISTQTSSIFSREPIIFSLRVLKSKETQFLSVRSFGYRVFSLSLAKKKKQGVSLSDRCSEDLRNAEPFGVDAKKGLNSGEESNCQISGC